MDTPERQLREFLSQYFANTDLMVLCDDMGIDWETIPGYSKTEKVLGLVSYCKRHTRFERLWDKVAEQRPNQWNKWDGTQVEIKETEQVPEHENTPDKLTQAIALLVQSQALQNQAIALLVGIQTNGK